MPLQVFTQRNFVAVADLIRLKKHNKALFGPPFVGLRGNVRTPSIARWKARGQFPIRHNRTFLLSFIINVISGNLSKQAFFEGDGSLSVEISHRRRRRQPTTVDVRKLE